MRPMITSDSQRNSLFHRTHAAASLDDYSAAVISTPERHPTFRHRFDNSSFIKSLSDENSPNSSSPSGSGRFGRSSSANRSGHHHHSSVHEMLKTIGKKVHIWPSRRRHESTSVITSPTQTPFGDFNDPQENFRGRSKSLDVKPSKSPLTDCDATYKIFDKIVKEGILCTHELK